MPGIEEAAVSRCWDSKAGRARSYCTWVDPWLQCRLLTCPISGTQPKDSNLLWKLLFLVQHNPIFDKEVEATLNLSRRVCRRGQHINKPSTITFQLVIFKIQDELIMRLAPDTKQQQAAVSGNAKKSRRLNSGGQDQLDESEPTKLESKPSWTVDPSEHVTIGEVYSMCGATDGRLPLTYTWERRSQLNPSEQSLIDGNLLFVQSSKCW